MPDPPRVPGLPSIEQADEFIREAGRLNPGPWVSHSRNVAGAARLIAAKHPALHAEDAYILGYLHDIGRREGSSGMHHMIHGYTFLTEKGYPGAARICLTHSFPFQNVAASFGVNDCSGEEYEFLKGFIASARYDRYDELIQFCDTVADAHGFCLLEKRMIDVALRHGVAPFMIEKWKAVFCIKSKLEEEAQSSIYDLLPGVVQNTFDS